MRLLHSAAPASAAARPTRTASTVRDRSRRRRSTLTAVLALALLATGQVVPDRAQATSSDDARRQQSLESAPDVAPTDLVASETLDQPAPAPAPRVVAADTAPVTWPDESAATITVGAPHEAPAPVDDATGPATAESLVHVEQLATDEDAATVPEAVEVQVADRAGAAAAGVDGLLLAVAPVDAIDVPAATPAPDATAEQPAVPAEPTEPTVPAVPGDPVPSPGAAPSEAAPAPTSSPSVAVEQPAVVERTAYVRPTEAEPAPTSAGAPEPEPAGTDAPVLVTVDYSSFAGAFGADWSARLRLVALPACALDTPAVASCRTQTDLGSVNDAAARTVSAEVPLPAVGALAVTAGTSGPAGTWSATSLSRAVASDPPVAAATSATTTTPSTTATTTTATDPAPTTPTPSATWDVSPRTGDLTGTYPLPVPPAAAGPEPDLALAYSSRSVDAVVSSANPQASWVGDGWDLSAGYVERSYVPCAPDAEQTGDLCWSADDATLVLGGVVTPLVRDVRTGSWRLLADDGSRVERLTGAPNGDDDGEYWVLTATDGTRYVFGRGRRSDSDATELGSAWTVPVRGDQAGEPCAAATPEDSVCSQAWRWNLDYVVDTSGGSMTYFYAAETNAYGRGADATAATYDRGGYLARVEYGQRAGAETSGPAPQRVDFTVAERCLPSGGATCDPAGLTTATARSWPDVPSDLICASTTSCPDVRSPSFFTRKRLTGITTSVLAGTTYREVDSWALTQTFPDPGDGTDASLWLASVTRSGRAGSAVTLPDVTFRGVPMANRVDAPGDDGAPMNRYRITSITSESGGTTSVAYTAPDCTSTDLPASPDTNTRRCSPVLRTSAGSTAPVLDHFRAYLVTSVVENGADGLSAAVETRYSYVGGAAWHHDDSPWVPAALRTGADFRGYATVDVIEGAAAEPVRTSTRLRYFRGMDGDALAAGGRRSVTVDGIADQDRLAGFLRERISSSGVGGGELSGELRTPWVSAPTATAADGRAAGFVDAGRVDTRTTAPALPGGRRTTRTGTTFDATTGAVTQVDDQGDVSTATDDLCTRVTYPVAGPTGVVAPARVETVAVSCGVPPSRPAQVVADTRTRYDGAAYGTAPTRGLVTATEVLASYAGGTPVYVTDASTTYDQAGRVTAQADALGRTTTTAYTPAAGGPLTRTTVTSPDPDGAGPLTAHVTTTDLDPARGLPTRVLDPNGKVTTTARDALGRVTAVWLPGRAAATATPTVSYAYTVSRSGPDAVSTSALTATGGTRTSVELYDGLLRPRQTQEPSAARDTAGRVVTDTVYDSRGLVAYENGMWFTTGVPGTGLVAPTVAVPSRTRHAYDGAGREIVSAFDVDGRERWRTTTTYGGDRVSTDPPTGGVAQTTVVDARGRTTELRNHTTGAPSGTYKATTYGYTPAGALASVRDSDGSTWTATYDLRGRQTSSTDPDTGRTTRTFDAAGQVLTTTDATGRTLAATYDALGRQTTSRDGSAGGAVRARWTYDTLAKGLLTAATRYVGAAEYVTGVTGYDDGYRPLGESVTLPSAEGVLAGTYTTRYTYTVDGQRASITYPASGALPAETVRTEYDETNRPEWMYGGLGWGVYVATSRYSSYGQLLQTDLGNTYSNIVDYGYEQGTGRLTRTILAQQTSAGYGVDLGYTYDDAGAVTSIVDRSAGQKVDTQCFARDGLGRLRNAWTPKSGSCATPRSVAGLGGPAPYWKEYTVDSVGNRLTQVTRAAAGTTTQRYAYPPAGPNRTHGVQSVATTRSGRTTTSRYTTDAAGRTTIRVVPGSPTRTLTWDAEGLLASARVGTSTSTYLYSADGDRLIRRQGGKTAVYLPGGQEFTLTPSTGGVTVRRYYTFADQTVAVRTGKSGSAVSSLVTDLDGTAVAAVANTTGVVTRRRFDPFGVARGATPTWQGDHGFGDAPLDKSGLIALGDRYYDAGSGRFVSPDRSVALAMPQQGAYATAVGGPGLDAASTSASGLGADPPSTTP